VLLGECRHPGKNRLEFTGTPPRRVHLLEKGGLAARRGRQDAPVGGECGSPSPVPAADCPSPWSGTVSRVARTGRNLPWHCWREYPLRHDHTTTISGWPANDARQHARQRRAAARGVIAGSAIMKRCCVPIGGELFGTVVVIVGASKPKPK
jgi:hypothetical protein